MSADPSELVNKIPLELDLQFYSNFDPFFHYTAVQSIRLDKVPKHRLIDQEGNTSFDHSVVERINSSYQKHDNTKSLLGRVFRYFSSETLVLLLISGYPFATFAKVSSLVRAGRLNSAFHSIAKRQVPEGFSLSVGGNQLSFSEWLSARIMRDHRWISDNSRGSLIDLVVEEAKLLKERGAINAFKHGKSLSFGEGFKIKMRHHGGGREEVSNLSLNGLNWVDWRESASKLSIGLSTEEVRPEEDLQRLFAIGLLMDVIRTVRLAYLNGQKNFTIHTPSDFRTGLEVRRQKFTFNFHLSD